MDKSSINRALMATYVIGHFAVDFACAFLLFRMVQASDHWYICILLYNFCAFALQLPFGLLADRWNHNALCAAIGCGMVVLAYGIGNISMSVHGFGSDTAIIMVVIAGIGNALFHIGGGIDVLNSSQEKIKLLGMFVAPGALGIYLGTLYGKQDQIAPMVVAIIISVIAMLILLVCYYTRKSFRSDNVPLSLNGVQSSGILLALLCFLFVVILRSYTGMTADFPWKGQGEWGIALVCGVILGKVGGGFMGDWIGVKATSILSLTLAALFYLLSGYPTFGTVAVFLFNMTMPITLWGVAQILKGAKGFAFGLLTFGLYIGFLPVYMEWTVLPICGLTLAITSICSMILIIIGLRKAVG